MRQSRRWLPVNIFSREKLGTMKPTTILPTRASVNRRPCQMILPLPNCLTGTWNPMVEAKKILMSHFKRCKKKVFKKGE